MSDISITAANVKLGAQTTPTKVAQYGEAVTQGQPVYKFTDGKHYRCDANDGVAKAVCAGIALTPGSTDDYGLIALPSSTPGRSLVNLGATLTVGTVYAVSATVGGIAPQADLTSGQFITTLGIATTAALLDFQVAVSNTARA
jgi:hypothetical protein